jgi:hypothetical protein
MQQPGNALAVMDDEQEVLTLTNPATGEILTSADATREQVAAWFLAMRWWQEQAATAVRLGGKLFADLTDKETTLGVRVDGFYVSVPGAQDKEEIDTKALRGALLDLVAEGRITQQAADDACRPLGCQCPHCDGFVPTGGVKVSHKALNVLRKQPDLAAIIDGCIEYTEPTRALQVKRA